MRSPYDQLSREELIRLLETRGQSRAEPASAEKFALAFRACPDPILISHLHDGKIIEANEAFYRVYGVPAAQVIGRTTTELGIWSEAGGRQRLVDKLKAEGHLCNVECVIKVASGESRTGLVSAEPIQIEGEECLVVIFHDVTQQKMAELALRESEQRFFSLAAAAFEGIGITEAGRVIEVNDQMAQMLGYTREELIGRNVIELVEPASRPFVEQMMRAGQPGPYEHLAARKDGTTFPVEVQARSLTLANRQFRVTSIRDITVRKAAEESFRASEERLRATIEHTPHVAVQWYDAQGHILFWNRASETIFGWKASEAVGKTLDQLIFTPVETARFQQLLSEIERTGNPAGPDEHHFRRRDGTAGVCLSTTFRIPTGTGRFCIVCMDVDITAQKRAVEALRASEERFELAVRGSNDGLWDWDVRTNGVYYAHRYRELLGYGPTEFPDVPESFNSHLHPEDHDRTVEAARAHLEDHAPYDVEFRLRNKSGEYRWFRARGQAVWDETGRAIRMAGSITDIHDHKVAAESLRRAQEQALIAREEYTQRLISAQEQERKRLANELHDSLGQNLSLIKNRAYLALQESTVPPAVATHLQAISEVVTDAIGETRNLAQNLRPLHIDRFGLTDALENLVQQSGESVSIPIEQRLEDVDDLFHGEEATNVYRIVQEALNNLVKHAHATRAVVRLERDLHFVRICVEDDGRGFDPNAIATNHSNRTGIGLSSIGERTRMLGGTLEIQSAPGRGTKISIQLPIAPAAPPSNRKSQRAKSA